MNSNHVMLDLETLDTVPGGVILSIGAVYFDYETQELGEDFHKIISVKESENIGLTISVDTFVWWNKQSVEARKTLIEAEASSTTPKEVFDEFNLFLDKGKNGWKKVKLWGNGSDFDNIMLASAYEKAGVTLGWKYYNHRCHRTLKNLRPDIKIDRVGTHHNALDDAKSQAEHAMRILKALKL